LVSLICWPIWLTALPVAVTALPAPSVTLATGVVAAVGVGFVPGPDGEGVAEGLAPLPEPPEEQPASKASAAAQATATTFRECWGRCDCLAVFMFRSPLVGLLAR
jgi:hypothetical protein